MTQIIYTLSPSGLDDTPLIQGVFTEAPDLATVYFEPGRYRLSAGLLALDKRLTIWAYGAVFNWWGKGGTVFTFGSSPGKSLQGGGGWTVEGLAINHAGVGEPVFANQTVAVQWQNIDSGVCRDLNVNGFGVGLSVIGDGAACAYNRFGIRALTDCQTSLRVRAVNGGFATENTFDGGNWQSGPIAKNSPVVHMDLAGPHVGGSRFMNASYQGWGGQCTLAKLASVNYSWWLYNRYESTDMSGMLFTLDLATQYCSLFGSTSPCVDWQDATPKNKTTNQFRPLG